MVSNKIDPKFTFLHVGCGPKNKLHTTRGFNSDAWREIRLDIDATVLPDVTGSITHMPDVEDSSVDAIFSSHNIEHLYPHEVHIALVEFLRVLKHDGFAVITCPDLQSVSKLIAEDKLLDPAYDSPAGPITPLDILYGFRPSLAQGNHYMAHRCGFTRKALQYTLIAAGFKSVATVVREPFFDIWGVATKLEVSEPEIRKLAGEHFPRWNS